MSALRVVQYQEEVDRLIRFGGSRNEGSISIAFQKLLDDYCRTQNFLLIPQLEIQTKSGKRIRPDGTVKDALRLEWGYWESKDEYDNLDAEIAGKLSKGYPDNNILFEDAQTAVLIQHGQEAARVSMRDADALDRTLTEFIRYERPEIKEFRKAIAKFKEDLPAILEALRDVLRVQESSNAKFLEARSKFWEMCQQSINPEITLFDIQEMVIQHILTEDIFLNVFQEAAFHRENNIARELHEIINTFLTRSLRKNTLGRIEHYYGAIKTEAASIANHHEKQKFLKALYEDFYQAYNPKAADRLGIVYTPNEIVRFMIESTDRLLHKHFGKLLSDSGVKILDPCTGTGTYVTELIEYLPPHKLKHKYQHEIFCNEVGILPYYIANLNIEYTYQQKMGEYEEFQNICFVDTLDHTTFEGKQGDLFAMSVENTERIKRQNSEDIFVIIGNPPYNANQANENDNNRNRIYQSIDQQIKKTYVARSTAQKMKMYDMYSRFFRWASSRLSKDGVLAFITNSSFISARGFDGFRKAVAEEFNAIYIIDLGGDVRKNPKLSGTKHNVFGIQTGVAISFMVKQASIQESCKIFLFRCPEYDTAEEKLDFLVQTNFQELPFERISPDKHGSWLDTVENKFETLLPVCSKKVKSSNDDLEANVLYKLYSNGISTNRDEWVYDLSASDLLGKASLFIEEYNSEVERWLNYKRTNKIVKPIVETSSLLEDFLSEKRVIKWSSRLKRDKLLKSKKGVFSETKIVKCLYRPFCYQLLYLDYMAIDLVGQQSEFFPSAETENYVICLSGQSFSKPFQALAVNSFSSLDLLEKTSCISLYRYDENGDRHDNITDWGLGQFQVHYSDRNITKLNIFHYTYAVLHHPVYRRKYELNLKREFPRLPFYENFHQWAAWGEQLMELHINYETVEPFGLVRRDVMREDDRVPKAKLKADKTKGSIALDEDTTLEGVPAEAWEYKLGNRSALEWILDQYKEKKPKDPTIREKFNTYRFADYKEQVIDLLDRVCRVSIETMQIISSMPNEV